MFTLSDLTWSTLHVSPAILSDLVQKIVAPAQIRSDKVNGQHKLHSNNLGISGRQNTNKLLWKIMCHGCT